MMKFKSLLAVAALAMLSTSAIAQSPPFNAGSIATLGGNCSIAGSIPYQSTGGITLCVAAGTNGQVMRLNGSTPEWYTVVGTGSVTSVGLTLPSMFTVSNSPVTAAGNLTATLASQSANTVLAAPTGVAGTPTFRALVAADIPAIAISGVTGLQTALDAKAPLASPPLTGTPTAPTATAGTSTTQLATTAFVTTADNLKAPLASPPLTGTPTAPTGARGLNSTQLATTAFVQANKNTVDPIDYGAACDGSTDDTAALVAAISASNVGRTLSISCTLRLEGNAGTISVPTIFSAQGRLLTRNPAGAVVFASNSQIFAAYRQFILDDPLRSITMANMPGPISACWWGACSGATDVSNLLRTISGVGLSGKTLYFPGGNYNLCSAVPAGTGPGTVGYPAFNQASVIIKGQSGFKIDAESYGVATFTTCPAIAQNQAFQIDTNTDFEWVGGAFVGNRTGLATTTVNTPFGLVNNQRFTLRRARAVSGYHDAGAMFEGDFNTDFIIEDNIGNAGQGIDMAFSCNAVYRNNRFTGSSTSPANIGIKGFSHIMDGPLAGYGTTYCTSAATNVRVEGNTFDNYVSGIVIQNGSKWKITDNTLLNIKGDTGLPASGVLLNYNPTGPFSNVGNTPFDVTIEGNHIDGIGANVAGCAVNIGANAIANSDTFNNIFVNGNSYAGSAASSGVCSDTNSAAKVPNFFVGINAYRNLGANMNSNAAALAKPASLPR